MTAPDRHNEEGGIDPSLQGGKLGGEPEAGQQIGQRFERMIHFITQETASPDEQAVVHANYEEGSQHVRARWGVYEMGKNYLDVEALTVKALGLKGNERFVDVGTSDGEFFRDIVLEYGYRGLDLIGVELHPIQFMNSRYWGPLRPSRTPGAPEHYVLMGNEALEQGVFVSATFIEGSATDLPVKTDSADVVSAMFMLYHISDPGERRAALLDMKRVLKPGGKLVVATSGVINKMWHRVIEQDIAKGLTSDLHVTVKPPSVMNTSFTTEVAHGELEGLFKHMYLLEYEDIVEIDTEEKYEKYKASLLSMRNQFQPIPSDADYTRVVEAQMEQVRLRMHSDDPFCDSISRAVFICTDTPYIPSGGFEKLSEETELQ